MKEKTTQGLVFGIVLVLIFIIFTAVPMGVSAQGDIVEEWVARYNGPGNFYDSAQAIALDSSGNIYVTGYSYGSGTSYDYATAKYDTEGNELWVARYNGPGNFYDSAQAIALDSSGNVYVTGYSDGSGTRYDYATIKYDPEGNELWVARYNGPGNSYDYANAIALDSSGNVYVTGYSDGSGTDYDYATIKYNTEGNELWVDRYNGPENFYDWAQAIALDSSSNVYVTGYSYGSGTDYDYATVKYDTDGNELWVTRYNGPGNFYDYANAIALDSSGNVYVTGASRSSDSSSDYATVKYDPEGNELWVDRYNGPGNFYDYAQAIALDSSGNVYVTGYSYGSGTDYDYATVKYDTDGNELWAARYNGPANFGDLARAIAIDSSGNAYVTGVTGFIKGSVIERDYATVKYDPEGNELWVDRYNGPADFEDQACAIAIDSAGNAYVTGESLGSGTWHDYATIKYSQVDDITVNTEKVKVNWDHHDIHLYGRLYFPDSFCIDNLNPVGSAVITLAAIGVVDQNIEFEIKGKNDDKLEYEDKNNRFGNIKDFKIDWKGAKFDYKDDDIHIHTHLISDTETIFCIHSDHISGAFSVNVNGSTIYEITIAYDKNRTITTDVVYDLRKDDNSHVHFILPFQLTSDMTIAVSGAIELTINVADYFDEAYAKFKLASFFDSAFFPEGTGTMPDTLTYEITLGDGMDMILGSDLIGVEKVWTKKDNKHWEYK